MASPDGFVSVLTRVSDSWPLPSAAREFAAAGVPVFPCVPGGKSPLTTTGFHEATTNLRRIRSWWRWMPAANIGVPTGQASGVEVVDVDQKTADSGFPAFERARHAGLVGEWLALIRTPSGGMHAYYPADPHRPQSSWEAADAHVDFRGAGGYVIVPPSMVEVGDDRRAPYALISRQQARVSPVDAAALRDLLAPRPEPAPYLHGVGTPADAERLAFWVARRSECERNRSLFWAACRLAEAGASLEATYGALGPAAERAGLPRREVAVTIRSAYRTTGPSRRTTPTGASQTPRRAPQHTTGRVLS